MAAEELHAFDFSTIDDMDPSLSGGHKAVYEREVPFELRVQQAADAPQEVGTLEAVKVRSFKEINGLDSHTRTRVTSPAPHLRLAPHTEALIVTLCSRSQVKLLLLGDEASPSAIRMELTSENDLFFNYTHTLEPDGFRTVQEAQKLMVEFGEYPSVLTRMLDTCIREPHSHLAVFVMQRGGKGHLDFIQNMEYKFVELLSCSFVASGTSRQLSRYVPIGRPPSRLAHQTPPDVTPRMCADDETVRQSIAFRYNAVKSRLALMQARLQDINALVKIKNPSLLLQLQRAPPRFPSGGVVTHAALEPAAAAGDPLLTRVRLCIALTAARCAWLASQALPSLAPADDHSLQPLFILNGAGVGVWGGAGPGIQEARYGVWPGTQAPPGVCAELASRETMSGAGDETIFGPGSD